MYVNICAYTFPYTLMHTERMHPEILLADNYKHLERPEKQQLCKGEAVGELPRVRQTYNDSCTVIVCPVLCRMLFIDSFS